MKRRNLLSSEGAMLASRSQHAIAPLEMKQGTGILAGKADHELRIAACILEIGPRVD